VVCLVLHSIPVFPSSWDYTKPNEVPALVQTLKNGDEEARRKAAYRLGEIWPRDKAGEAISALIIALRDPSYQVRWTAASSLGRLEATEAVDALIKATNDQIPVVAQSAAQSLGQVGPPALRAEPYILELLADKDYTARKIAAVALSRMSYI